METIYETYIRTLCSNCKNKSLDLCNVRKNIRGNLQCCYYIKDKQHEGYNKYLCRTAEQEKPIMRI